MASEKKSRGVEKETERLVKSSEKILKKQAQEFSNNINDISDSLKDFTSNAHSLMKQLNEASDPKVQKRLLKDISNIQSDFEKQEKSLRDGLRNFGDYMSDKSKDITGSLLDNAEHTLKSIDNLSSSMSDSIEKRTKKSSAIYQKSQDEMLKKYEKSLKVQSKLVEQQNKDLQKYYNTTSQFYKNKLAKRLASRNEEMDNLISTIDRLRGKIDNVDDSLVTLADTVEDRMSDISDSILDITDEIGDQVSKSFSDMFGEIREAMMSLELNAIFQGVGEDIDNFVENRRQTLSRVGNDFDEDAYSKTISGVVKDLSSYSRTESSEFVSEFVKQTRIQNMEKVDNYVTEMAAQAKAYGVAVSDLENLMWQDKNSGSEGKMFQSVSNIAGLLENDKDLNTSADSILSALNEKAEDIYGLASGDSKTQMKMYKSVASIQAIQDSAANKGVSDLAEGLSTWSSMSRMEMYKDDNIKKLAGNLGMSIDEFHDTLKYSENGAQEIFAKTKAFTEGLSEAQVNALRENGTLGWASNDASILALRSMDWNDFNEVMRNTTDTISKVDTIGDRSIAQEKENKTVSRWTKMWNDFKNNPISNFFGDMAGELDFSLANAANAVVVASNVGSFYEEMKKWTSGGTFGDALKGGLSSVKGTLTQWFPKLSTGASKLSGVFTSGITKLGGFFKTGMSSLGTAFTSGLSNLGTFASNAGSTIANGASSTISSLTGAGGLLQGASLTSWGTGAASKAISTLGPAAGGLLALKDAIVGVTKSKDWLGDEAGSTASGKVSSFIGGALGGSSSGVKGALGGAAKGALIGSFAGPIGTAIGGLIGGVTGAIGGERITKFIKGTWDTVSDLGGKAFTYVSGKMDKGVENFAEFTSDKGPLTRSLGNMVQNNWNTVKETGKEIKDLWADPDKGFFSKVGGTLVSVVTLPFKQLGGIVSGLKDGFSSFFSDLGEGLSGVFSGVKKDYQNYKDNGGKFGVLGYAGSKIKQGASIVGDKVKGFLGFADGLSEVPNDGWAYIHKGEAVLTADQAVNARADGGIDTSGNNILLESINDSLEIIRKLNGISFKDNSLIQKLQKDFYEKEDKARKYDKKYQKSLLKGITGSALGGSSSLLGTVGKLWNFVTGKKSSGSSSVSSGSVSGGVASTLSSTLSGGSSSLASFVSDMTSQHEGSIGSINHNDNGAVSLGTMQWHGSNAKDLLTSIRDANTSQFDSIINQYGAQSLADSLSSSDNWGTHTVQKGSAEDQAIQALLNTKESQSIQDQKKLDFAQSYIDRGKSFGIKDEKALAYLADMYNQYGLYSKTINDKIIPEALKNGGDLDALYNATLSNTNKYLDRRSSVYESLKGADFSSLSSGGLNEVPHSSDWVTIAMSQKGFKEGDNNDTLFGSWIGAPNQPWCASFVSWALAQAGVSGLKSAAVSGLMSQAQSMGVYMDKNSGYVPGYGDIFFNKGNGASHTGFVLSSSGGSFTTIEGNAGDMVKTMTWSLTDPKLSGFAALGNKGSMDTSNLELSSSEGVSTYAQGTPWIPNDQLALLHEGEAVVPAELNPYSSLNNTSEMSSVSSPNYDLNGSGSDDIVNSIQWMVKSLGEKLDRLIIACSATPRKTINPNTDTHAVFGV